MANWRIRQNTSLGKMKQLYMAVRSSPRFEILTKKVSIGQATAEQMLLVSGRTSANALPISNLTTAQPTESRPSSDMQVHLYPNSSHSSS